MSKVRGDKTAKSSLFFTAYYVLLHELNFLIGSGRGGGGECFPSDAMVTTPTGMVAMERIKVSQEVLAS